MRTALAESLALETAPPATQITSRVREYAARRDTLRNDFNRTRDAAERSQKAAVTRWLSASPRNAALHEKHRRERRGSPGSGAWLPQHSLIHSWMQTTDNKWSRVWLDGESGIGTL